MSGFNCTETLLNTINAYWFIVWAIRFFPFNESKKQFAAFHGQFFPLGLISIYLNRWEMAGFDNEIKELNKK